MAGDTDRGDRKATARSVLSSSAAQSLTTALFSSF